MKGNCFPFCNFFFWSIYFFLTKGFTSSVFNLQSRIFFYNTNFQVNVPKNILHETESLRRLLVKFPVRSYIFPAGNTRAPAGEITPWWILCVAPLKFLSNNIGMENGKFCKRSWGKGSFWLKLN